MRQNFLDTLGNKPTPSEIEQAELVPNLADGTLWTKNSSNVVITVGGIGEGTGIEEPPDDDLPRARIRENGQSIGSWVFVEEKLQTDAPVLSGASVVNEGEDLDITITNHSPTATYNITPVTGSTIRVGDTITFTADLVAMDTAGSVTVTAQESGEVLSNQTVHNLTVLDVPFLEDQALIYDSASMTEFVKNNSTELTDLDEILSSTVLDTTNIVNTTASSDTRNNPEMTSDTLPSGLCFGSTKLAGREYFHAFDAEGSGSTWITDTVSTGIIGYIFASSIIINKYLIRPDDFDVNRAARDWTLQGSNDTTTGLDGTWFTLDTQATITDWAVGVTKEFSFANTTSYLGYRINCTLNNGASAFALRRIELYENEASSADTLVTSTQIIEGERVVVDSTEMIAGTVTFLDPTYSIDTTVVTSGATPTTAYINEHRSLSNIVVQDGGDTDFIGVIDGSTPFQGMYEFINISTATVADTLTTDTPIVDGDNLVIVLDNDSINEIVASGVTGTGPYSMDTTSTTSGEVPTRVFAVDAIPSFEIGGGFIDATIASDSYVLDGTELTTTRTFNDIVDVTGSTTLQTSTNLGHDATKMIDLRCQIVKEPT